MRRNVLLTALLLGLLIFVPPAFALSISGTAFLDWSALTMTGIDFTLSDSKQLLFADIGSTLTGASNTATSFTNDWVTSAISVALPPVGSATANESNIAINSSLSLVSNYTFGAVKADRNVTITASSTGLFTVSIPYQIQVQGPISGEWSSITSASIQFTNHDLTGGIAYGASFEHFNGSLGASGEAKAGIASLTIPFTRGQTGLLNFDTRMLASVPVPETFWSFATGLILLGLVHRWMTSLA
jgi:hypothetical protein